MIIRKFILLYIFLILLIACKDKVSKISKEALKKEIPFKVWHFERDIFNVDLGRLKDTIPYLRLKYGEFFDLFSYKIIRIGSPEDPNYSNFLLTFLTDYNINRVKKRVDSVFKDFDAIEGEKIKNMFKYYIYYFPELKVPQVITYISGFNQSIVTTDTILGISLDKYLGGQCEFYNMLGLPRYLRIRMSPEYIVTDCAKAWAITQFSETDSSDHTLLSTIIDEGKIIYFAKMLLPDEPDTLIFGLTSQDIEWCKKYEAQMWEYLVEKKHLFSSDFQLIKRYIDPAPFTKDFGQKSPGRAVVWIGYNIVKNYADNTKAHLPKIMFATHAQEILKKSRYKP